MPLYDLTQDAKLQKLKETSFKNEKEMQRVVESNLSMLFSLDFVASELAIGGLRFDTLGFDPENKSFVIIEFKNDRNFSVIDQGYSYLALLLNNKSDFILEYNESKKQALKRDDLDWSQSRVLFVAPEFTKYQKGAINFKDLPIELWEIKRFENNTILLEPIQSPESSESIETISPKGEAFRKVSKEIKVCSESDHLEGLPEEIVDLYENLKARAMSLGGVEISPKKHYVGFKANGNFAYVQLQKSQIKITINLGKEELDDPKKMAIDISEQGHRVPGWYQIFIGPEDDLDYVMSLIKQSYRKQMS